MIVFYHGAGQNADTHMESLNILNSLLPTTDIVVANGPVRYLPKEGKEDENRRSWVDVKTGWQLTKFILNMAFDKVAVMPQMMAFEESELKKRGLPKDRYFRMGFSMGAGMSIILSQIDKEKCGGVISVGGMVCPYPDFRMNSKSDTIMIVGDKDYFYDFSNPRDSNQRGVPQTNTLFFRMTGLSRFLGLGHDQTVERLKSKGIAVHEMIIPGMGHTINAEAVRGAADFIKARLPAVEEKLPPADGPVFPAQQTQAGREHRHLGGCH